MFTWRFWRETIERAVKDVGLAELGLWVLSTGGPVNALTADWQLVGGTALGAAVLSVASALASLPVGASDSPSAIQ